MYVSQTIILYTLNLYSDVSQSFHNKTGEISKVKRVFKRPKSIRTKKLEIYHPLHSLSLPHQEKTRYFLGSKGSLKEYQTGNR